MSSVFNGILVPLDGSPVAEQAVPYAMSLASSLATPIHVLRACQPPRMAWPEVDNAGYGFRGEVGITDPDSNTTALTYYMQRKAYERMVAEQYVANVARFLSRRGLQITTAVEDGPAADVILSKAYIDPSMLIVMGTHGRTGLPRIMHGSVADSVLHQSVNPVLLVHSEQEQDWDQPAPVKNIVLALDGSVFAEGALAAAAVVGRALDAAVFPLWVVPHSLKNDGDDSEMTAAPAPMTEATDAVARTYLNDIASRLTDAGVAKVEPRVLHEDPAMGIVELAQRLPDTLVVMTTHGRSGMGRWILGSIADRVVARGNRPVLLIRPYQMAGQPSELHAHNIETVSAAANPTL